MFQDRYKRLYDGIVPSADVAARVRAAMARGQKPRRIAPPRLAVAALALVACLAVLLFTGVIPGPGGKNSMYNRSDTVHMIMDYRLPPPAKLYFDPETTRSETWDLSQSIAFLGRDPRPAEPPAGLMPLDADAQFVMLNNDGSMAYGVFRFEYSDTPEDPHSVAARGLGIEVSKDGLSPTCLRYLDDDATRSVISGVEVALGYIPQAAYGDDGEATGETIDTYHAEFMHAGLGYRVNARGLSQDEFVDAIRGLIR